MLKAIGYNPYKIHQPNIDEKILYKESIEDFDKISIIDKDQDIYQVRNSSKAKIIKAKHEWSMFANKSSQNNI